MKKLTGLLAITVALGLLAGSLSAQASDLGKTITSPAVGSVIATTPPPSSDAKNAMAKTSGFPSGTQLHIVMRDGKKMVPIGNFASLDAAVNPNAAASAVYYMPSEKFTVLSKVITPHAPVTCNVYEDGRVVAGLPCVASDLIKTAGLDSDVAMIGVSPAGHIPAK